MAVSLQAATSITSTMRSDLKKKFLLPFEPYEKLITQGRTFSLPNNLESTDCSVELIDQVNTFLLLISQKNCIWNTLLRKIQFRVDCLLDIRNHIQQYDVHIRILIEKRFELCWSAMNRYFRRVEKPWNKLYSLTLNMTKHFLNSNLDEVILCETCTENKSSSNINLHLSLIALSILLKNQDYILESSADVFNDLKTKLARVYAYRGRVPDIDLSIATNHGLVLHSDMGNHKNGTVCKQLRNSFLDYMTTRLGQLGRWEMLVNVFRNVALNMIDLQVFLKSQPPVLRESFSELIQQCWDVHRANYQTVYYSFIKYVFNVKQHLKIINHDEELDACQECFPNFNKAYEMELLFCEYMKKTKTELNNRLDEVQDMIFKAMSIIYNGLEDHLRFLE